MPILTPQERIGQVAAGRYRLDALLSTGGMGVLFRAFDCERAAVVAVKMLKATHVLEADRVARFGRETRIARQVAHPHIAHTFDAFSDEHGVPFLVMELLEGRTLAQELDARGVLPLDEALAIVLPIVRALETTHALGIVHRDLKPSNIFLCRDADGRVTPKLIDFGIAKGPCVGFETETGVLLGTPGYMAPELVQYAECSVFTDVWGVGAVLYRCLAGHPPHASDSQSELLQKLVREPVPAIAGPGISRQLGATIDRALARDPHRRYASMAALASALEAFTPTGVSADTNVERITLEPPAPAARPAARLRNPGRLPVAAFAVSCLLAVSAFAAQGTSDAPRTTRSRLMPASTLVRVDATAVPSAAVAPHHDAAPLRDDDATYVETARRNPRQRDERLPPAAAPDRSRVPAAIKRRSVVRPPARAVMRDEHPAPDERRAEFEREVTTGLPVATEW